MPNGDVWKCNKCGHKWRIRSDKPNKCANIKCQAPFKYLSYVLPSKSIRDNSIEFEASQEDTEVLSKGQVAPNPEFKEDDEVADSLAMLFENSQEVPKQVRKMAEGESRQPQQAQAHAPDLTQPVVSQPQAINPVLTTREEFMQLIASLGGGKRTPVIADIFFRGNIDDAEWLNKVLVMCRFDKDKRRMAITAWYHKMPNELGVNLDMDVEEVDELSDAESGKKSSRKKQTEDEDDDDDGVDPIKKKIKEMRKAKAEKMDELVFEKEMVQLQAEVSALNKIKSGGSSENKEADEEIPFPMVGPDGNPIPMMIKKKDLPVYMMIANMSKSSTKHEPSPSEQLLATMTAQLLANQVGSTQKSNEQVERERARAEQEKKEFQARMDAIKAESDARIKAIIDNSDKKLHDMSELVRQSNERMNQMNMEFIKQQYMDLADNYKALQGKADIATQMKELHQKVELAKAIGLGGVKTDEDVKREVTQGVQSKVINQLDSTINDGRKVAMDLIQSLREDIQSRGGLKTTKPSEDEKALFYQQVALARKQEMEAMQRQQVNAGQQVAEQTKMDETQRQAIIAQYSRQQPQQQQVPQVQQQPVQQQVVHSEPEKKSPFAGGFIPPSPEQMSNNIKDKETDNDIPTKPKGEKK